MEACRRSRALLLNFPQTLGQASLIGSHRVSAGHKLRTATVLSGLFATQCTVEQALARPHDRPICAGAVLVAHAGLLAGRSATTDHHLDELHALAAGGLRRRSLSTARRCRVDLRND